MTLENVEQVAVATLLQHPDNPRRGNVAAIKESITAFGWHGTVVAQTATRRVIAGNHRLLAAIDLGIETVPVFWADVDDDTARRILLADNRASDLATYDDNVLLMILRSVPDLAGTGYTQLTIEELARDLSGGEEQPWGSMGSKERDRDRWAAGSIRQLTLILTPAEYEAVLSICVRVCDETGLSSNTEAIMFMCNAYPKEKAS
jgi:hypothetical protein